MNRMTCMTIKNFVNIKNQSKMNKIKYSIINKKNLCTFSPPPEEPNNLIYMIAAIIVGSFIIFKK